MYKNVAPWYPAAEQSNVEFMAACPDCPSSNISDPVIDILFAKGASETHVIKLMCYY